MKIKRRKRRRRKRRREKKKRSQKKEKGRKAEEEEELFNSTPALHQSPPSERAKRANFRHSCERAKRASRLGSWAVIFSIDSM
jgi:hypothetical protein